MSEKSAIEWTDATWNPTTGCTKLSPACANCYIERTPPFRTKGIRFVKGHIPLTLYENRLKAPVRWKPSRVFVNSMSDLFHPDIPESFINDVYETMEQLAPQHVYQVLTKRAERMRDYLNWRYEGHRIPSRHIWHGVSAENQRMADERIPFLTEARSAIRFVSIEPMLGPIDMSSPVLEADCVECVDWVIVGGESGPRVRPMKPEWVRDIRDQCVSAGVPFFFKQWGGPTPKSGGRELDGRTWDEFPAKSGD